MTRALRTTALQKPRTQGERIRFARVACNLSQEQLGKAISAISKQKVSKSLVSKWERDGVSNPNNSNMLALQAATGFSVEWIVNGRGPQRAQIPSQRETEPLNPALLAKALAGAAPNVTMDYTDVARVAASLYRVLSDTPELEPAILAAFAAEIRRRNGEAR